MVVCTLRLKNKSNNATHTYMTHACNARRSGFGLHLSQLVVSSIGVDIRKL